VLKKKIEKLLLGESITPFVFIPLPFKTDFSFKTIYSLPLDCHPKSSLTKLIMVA